MFFLFGWGHTSKRKESETPLGVCTHCHTNNIYLTKVTKWITLFFIPVIPYESNYYFLCSNCDYGYEIEEDRAEGIKQKLEKSEQKKGKLAHPKRINIHYNKKIRVYNKDREESWWNNFLQDMRNLIN